MIINENMSKKVLAKLTKMKEISSVNVSQTEMNNYFHTINTFNTLERDENVVGGNVLSKYQILKQMEDLVLPAEVTISNSIKQINMLSDKYKNYNSKDHFTTNVELLTAADFNVINDAIAGAFKKSAELTDVETLKTTASIDNYVDREAHDSKCAPKASNYVPVELNVNISRTRYLTEDVSEELLLWFENNIFRALKKGK